MEVLAISFFFIFVVVFFILALIYNSRTLYFIAGSLFMLWGYMLLIYGVTETTIIGKTATQDFTYSLNTSTNLSQVSNIATVENYTNVQTQNGFTQGFGTVSILLGLLFAIVPILSEASGGKIKIV
jgi:hypothetical protein